MRNLNLQSVFGCSVAVCAMVAAAPSQAQTQIRTFNVPAQSAVSGIPEFARQADIQILVSDSAVRGNTTVALKGAMPVREALDRLIAGTGLKVASTDGRTFTLAAKDAPRGNAPSESARIAVSASPAEDSVIASGEIVVTASKRPEKLRDVPAAITALNGAAIEKLGIRDFRDYASLTPGLSQRDNGAPGTGTIILRGLNSGPEQTTNTTAFYIDDAAFSGSGYSGFGGLVTPSPDLGDIDRIEILKGPQGTLYGASSLGGIVRVITKKADVSRLSGSLQVEGETVAHGNQGGAVRAAINVPIIADTLAVRVSGFYRKTAGWVDNVFDGDKDVNVSTIKGGRIAVRAEPTDRLSIDVAAFYQEIDNRGNAIQDNVTGTLRSLYGRYKANYVTGYNSSTIKYRSLGGTATYETDIGNVIATANYVKTTPQIRTDYTQSYGPFLTGSFLLPPGGQVLGEFGPTMQKFSAEARFVSKRLGSLEFMAGGYYTNEKSGYPFLIVDRTAAGEPIPAPLDIFIQSDFTGKYEEYAAFGNLTFYLTDSFDVQGGIRYARNKNASVNPGGIIFFAPSDPLSVKITDSATTYLATVRYRPSRNVSLYARAASGYRPGGQQGSPIIPPGAQTRINADTVWNYEAGVKATALDGTLSVNASVYRVDWKGVQLNTLYNGILLSGNAGKARVEGFEFDLTARATRTLAIGAVGGHTNARLTAISPEAQETLGAAAGDKLPLTPGYTVAVYADQQIPLSDGLKASIGGTLRFEADKQSSYPGSLTNPNIKLPSITTVDLRAGLEIGDRYNLQLRVENLFDVEGIISAQTSALFPGQQVPTLVTMTRPRAVILSASAKF